MAGRQGRPPTPPGTVSRSGLFKIILRLTDVDKFHNRLYLVGCKTCKGTHIMNILAFQALKNCPKMDVAGRHKHELKIGERFGDLEVTGKAIEQRKDGLRVSTICRSCGVTRRDYPLWRLKYEKGPRTCKHCIMRY